MASRRRALVACAVLALAGAAQPARAGGGDPRLGEQYALTQLRAQRAWPVSQGKGVVVAVVDTGVDIGHPDLRGRLVPGVTFAGCGPRPCGNGDWRSGPAARRGEAFGHGTHVAGVIVSGRGNGVGIVGVAPLAKVMPVKIGDRTQVLAADIARGIRWAATHGAHVINLSLAIIDDDVAAAVEFAAGRGVVVVAAAGNRSEPTCVFPAALPEAICVTATDRNETPGAYSSGAVKEGLRSVAAPGGAGLPPQAAGLVAVPECGERILSTWPRGDAGAGRCPGEGGYRYLYGTSLAAPHVAGVAALLVARRLPADRVVETLLATARTPGVGTGVWTPQYGHGIVDATAAVLAR